MAEMKYLGERVDTLPTGPMQGVAASLQTSNEIPEPSSQSLSSEEEMEVIEQTTLPYPQVAFLLNLWRLVPVRQTYRFLRWRISVRSSGNMLSLPPESPSSQPKFMLFGAQAPPRPEDPRLSTKALVALPPSLQHSQWLSDGVGRAPAHVHGVGRAPAHVHHYIGLLWPWCLENTWEAVYTCLASCW
jgi:hypothetical protein